nr:unnamed protein product [Callosobruchus chinensis]
MTIAQDCTGNADDPAFPHDVTATSERWFIQCNNNNNKPDIVLLDHQQKTMFIIEFSAPAKSADETPVLPYAPGDIESVGENGRCRINWNCSFPTLELVQANNPEIVLLGHQQKTMFVIELSAPGARVALGSYTYTSDQRFQANHHPETDEWTLQIKWAQKRDAGIYECQISTQPVRSYFVNLNVVVSCRNHPLFLERAGHPAAR